MRRLAVLVLAPLLAVGAAALSVPTASSATVPTRVTHKDKANDVLINGGKANVHRTGDLDIRHVSAFKNGPNLVLTTKVRNLRPGHVRVYNTWKNDELTQRLGATFTNHLYLGGRIVWELTYGVDGHPQLHAYTNSKNPVSLGVPGCAAPKTVRDPNAFLQRADVNNDYVRFILPIRCLPKQYSTARVTATVMWKDGNGKLRWDDFYTRSTKGAVEKRSPLFRFR